MDPGSFDHKITFERRLSGETTLGAARETWSMFAEAWASRIDRMPRRGFEDDEALRVMAHSVSDWVTYQSMETRSVDSGDRIIDEEGAIHEVIASQRIARDLIRFTTKTNIDG